MEKAVLVCVIVLGTLFFTASTHSLSIESEICGLIEQSGLILDDDMLRLAKSMASRLASSRAGATVDKYFSSFCKWQAFIHHKGGQALPAQPVHCALYLTHLLDSGSSYSTVSTALYAIRWIHDLHSMDDPTKNSFVQNILESAKRHAKKTVCKKQPITSQMLIDLCQQFKDSNDLLIIRDLAMAVLGFAGFFRFDELRSIKRSDITIYDEYFNVQIRKSKTDQYRGGDEIVISQGESDACPYSMLTRYLSLAGLQEPSDFYFFRPAFRSGSSCKLIYKNKPLSYTRARECIVGRLRAVVGDLDIGLHSLRAGGATAAANANVNERCWKRHGRWRSESAKDGYVVDSLSSRLEVSRKLGL